MTPASDTKLAMPIVLLSYVLTLCSLALLADTGVIEPWLQRLHALPMGDKTLHLLLAGSLCLVVNLTMIGRMPTRRLHAVALGTLATLVAVTLEEFSNLLVAFRGFSLADLAANYLGVLIVGVLPIAAWLAMHSARTRSESTLSETSNIAIR